MRTKLALYAGLLISVALLAGCAAGGHIGPVGGGVGVASR